jgi:hypothetical protein
VKIVFCGCCRKRQKLRLIPLAGVIREQDGPVLPTPRYVRPTPCHGSLILMLTMTDSQHAALSIKVVDKKGNAAPVDGKPVWSTDNPDVLALTPSDDGLTCDVAAVGPLTASPVRVSVTADADLGAGVTDITGFIDVTIVAGSATSIEVTAGPPADLP